VAVAPIEGPDGSGGPHTFVDDLQDPELSEEDRHHLERVLRLRPGDALTVSDGAGGWRACRFGPTLEVAGEVQRVERATPPLTVAFALVKGGRPELIVQKLTELGIDVLAPFTAERSVVRWDADKAAANQVRLAKVAREAACQSKRCFLPEVRPATGFDKVAALPAAVRTDRGGPPLPPDLATVLVGPEGGWSPTEAAAVPATVGLAPHVLRSETAAITVSALLVGLRCGSVKSATLGGHRVR
jgi:16S rRNA (uracil1498-N3)-methyltransferase